MVIFGLAAALGLVVLATRLKINMSHGLVFGSVVVALTGQMAPLDFFGSVFRMWTAPKSLALLSVVALLMVLSQLLEKSGQMERLFKLVRQHISSPKLAMVSFPALIGLLPMPGGAVFSAPMVEGASRGCSLSQADKSTVNYWFRHIWEYCWPLYPSLILISSMSGIGFTSLLPAMIPVTLVSIAIGYFYILRKVKPSLKVADGSIGHFSSILILASPILVIVIGALGGSSLTNYLSGAYPVLKNLPSQVPMAVSLVLAVILAGFQGGRIELVTKSIFCRHTAMMIYFILAILTFQATVIASGGVDAISGLIVEYDLPLIALVMLLPFIMGLISGVALGYVASAFPVFIGLLPPDNMIPYLVLGHVVGFAGVLLSPAHACLVLSNKYFEAKPELVYRQLWLPTLLLIAFALLQVLIMT